MKTTFLDFEQQIADLEEKIDSLRFVQGESAVDIADEIDRLRKKSQSLIKDTYAKLSPWQVAQVARHPQRPYTLDYIEAIFTDFHEMHGDRAFADDPAIVGGMARFNGEPVMVIGHQKGRDTKDRGFRNFGMPRPEGYRKALRLMHMAERFGAPTIALIDTPGAYPGLGAEERGQAEAIARNLEEMAALRTPTSSGVPGSACGQSRAVQAGYWSDQARGPDPGPGQTPGPVRPRARSDPGPGQTPGPVRPGPLLKGVLKKARSDPGPGQTTSSFPFQKGAV